MTRSVRRILGGLTLAALLAVATGGAALAASPTGPAGTGSAIGEGASDVLAFFSGGVKGIVHGAVLGDGSVRVRAMVRGASASASYRVIGSATPCGQSAAGKAVLLGREPIMGAFVSRRIPTGTLPDRANVFASLRIMRVGGGQVACAQALSYRPVSTAGSPTLALTDILVSEFTKPGGPRGIVVVNGASTDAPQLRWSLTGLAGGDAFRFVGSTAGCGTPTTPATVAYRSPPQTRTYGILQESEFVDWSVSVRSTRITADGGQVGCAGRGRHVVPLL